MTPPHHVFTVTMRKLQRKDSGYYWCAVEIQGAGDKGAYLYLSVTAGPPGLWVEQQEVAGVEGGHVSVPCHYNEPSSMKKWCRIKGSCLEVNSGESGRSEMKDDRSKKVFTVTVRELNMEDTGWYWCAAGELQIPVHLTVTQKTTTTTVTTPTHSSASAALSTSLLVTTATTAAISSKPSTSKYSTVSTPFSPVPATINYNKSLSDLKIILMALGMLLLVAAVATVTWKLCKRHKGVQPHTGAREDRSNELTTAVSEDEVTYSTVFTNTQSSSHRISPHQSQPSENPADEVLYSSIILKNLQTTHSSHRSAADRAGDVIYSSVAGQKTQ
ncbi:hypothetical protein COCON_G00069850 [Conger conger]|uniref:Ig-like domain-containing protein n=1 Tax=Conger conger TaxID=82655 RepID=A0A9Q1I3L8_CONCO|nr:hypothetical protein COCON_G00069850 [Conger conger]